MVLSIWLISLLFISTSQATAQEPSICLKLLPSSLHISYINRITKIQIKNIENRQINTSKSNTDISSLYLYIPMLHLCDPSYTQYLPHTITTDDTPPHTLSGHTPISAFSIVDLTPISGVFTEKEVI